MTSHHQSAINVLVYLCSLLVLGRLGRSTAACAAMSAFSAPFQRRVSAYIRHSFIPHSPQFHLVATNNFWNVESLDRRFGSNSTNISANGCLLAGGIAALSSANEYGDDTAHCMPKRVRVDEFEDANTLLSFARGGRSKRKASDPNERARYLNRFGEATSHPERELLKPRRGEPGAIPAPARRARARAKAEPAGRVGAGATAGPVRPRGRATPVPARQAGAGAVLEQVDPERERRKQDLVEHERRQSQRGKPEPKRRRCQQGEPELERRQRQ